MMKKLTIIFKKKPLKDLFTEKRFNKTCRKREKGFNI